jgi:hypothetical protein
MTRKLMLVVTMLLLVACGGAISPDTPQGTAGAMRSPDAEPADDAIVDLPSCMQTCDGERMSPANRETCRLNCDNAFGDAASADPIGDAVTCLDRCETDASPMDCEATCKSAASASSAATIPVDVLDTLATCVHGCHADRHLTTTNRATCELNCAQNARVAAPQPPPAR